MLAAFIILSVVSLILVVLAIIIFIGKGDALIAGYNMASREAQEAYDKRRVRIIVGVLLLVIALCLPAFGILLTLGFKELVLVAFPATAFVLVAATFTTAHFWAKKKEKKQSQRRK